MVLDTSGLLAAIDSTQSRHAGARQAVEQSDGPYLISPFVLAELDYLLATRVGRAEQLALLGEVERGVYRLETFSASDVARARTVLERYQDLDLGLADASNVILANRYSTHDILTLDERHFRTVLGPGEQPFRILPADLEIHP
ncbi:MAG: PIN domain-containing protein [Rubrobacter sp.]|jgi:predicted nucleic acid-binding protein